MKRSKITKPFGLAAIALAVVLALSGCGLQGPASVKLNLSPAALVHALPGGSYDVTVKLVRQNYTGPVTLSLDSTPGFHATYSQNPVLGNSTVLHLRLDATLSPGHYPLRLVAKDVKGKPLGEARLDVTVEAPELSLALNPTSLSITPGQTANAVLTAKSQKGALQSVHLEVVGLPSGLTVTLSPNDFALNAGETKTVNVSINASASAEAGQYTLLFQATSNGRILGFGTLTVKLSQPGIHLSVSPSTLSLNPGDSGSVALTVESVGGFAGTVALSCTAPANVTCTLAASSVTLAAGGSKTVNATLALSSSASAASYTVRFKANAGSLSVEKSVTITSASTSGFNVTTPLAHVIRLRGQNNRSTAGNDGSGVPITYFDITRTPGYSAPIHFSIKQVKDPSGNIRPVNALFSEYRFTHNDSSSGSPTTTSGVMYLRADISPHADMGTWTVTVKALDLTNSKAKLIDVKVKVEDPFELQFYADPSVASLGPNQIAIKQGQEGPGSPRASIGEIGFALHPFITGDDRYHRTPLRTEVHIQAVYKDGAPLPLNGATGFFTTTIGYSSTPTSKCKVATGADTLGNTGVGIIGVRVSTSCSGSSYASSTMTQPLRIQISPNAKEGNYTVKIRGVRSAGGYWIVTGSLNDYFSPGGGYIPEQNSPAWHVTYNLDIQVQVDTNYLQLTPSRMNISIPAPSAGCIIRSTTIQAASIGDGVATVSVDKAATLSPAWAWAVSTGLTSCSSMSGDQNAYQWPPELDTTPATLTIPVNLTFKFGRSSDGTPPPPPTASADFTVTYWFNNANVISSLPWWTGTAGRKVIIHVEAP